MVDGTSVTLERISKMLNAVNGTVNVNAAQQTAAVQAQNLPFRGRTDFERTPDSDTYETGKKHKGLKRLVGLSALTAIGLAIASFVKGKGKLPEGSKFGDIMKTGWNEVKTGIKGTIKGIKRSIKKPDQKVLDKYNGVLNVKIKNAESKEALEKLAKGVEKYGSEDTKKAFENALKKFEEAA